MNYKNFMKEKAWLFTLLIGMIGLVGFGQTTSDLAQNSAVMLSDNDVGDMVIVVNKVPAMENTFIYTTDTYQMEVTRIVKDGCEYLKFGEAQALTENVIIVDDVGWQDSEFNIVYKATSSNMRKDTNQNPIRYFNKQEVATYNSATPSDIKNRYQYNLYLCSI